MRRDPWQALADPTRRSILEILKEGDFTINEVADKFEISRPAISKQIKILEECGILEIVQDGRQRICKVNPQPLEEVYKWVAYYEKFWLAKLDKLGKYLDNQ